MGDAAQLGLVRPWGQEQSEARSDCCREPERSHTPRGSPAGLRQGQNFGMAVGDTWQGCAGWLLGQVAFGLGYEHCVALLKPWDSDWFEGPLWTWQPCWATAVFASAGTQREVYKANQQTKKATMAETANSNITYHSCPANLLHKKKCYSSTKILGV